MDKRKRKRTDPELLARWAREREEFRALMKRRAERLAAADAREVERRARLRRLSFGLLGRS
jgi:hypothetical protein